jgi:hypothetical protein
LSYRVPEGVLRAELDGEEVMLNPVTGEYHLLNRTAILVIDSLERGHSLEEAVDAIVAESGASRDAVHADARSFLSAMLQRGLVEERAPADG